MDKIEYIEHITFSRLEDLNNFKTWLKRDDEIINIETINIDEAGQFYRVWVKKLKK